MTEYIAPNRAIGATNLPQALSFTSKMVGRHASLLARGNAIARKGSAAKTNSDDEWDGILTCQSNDTISAIRPQPHTSLATHPRTGFGGSVIASKGGDSLDGHITSRKRRDRSGSGSWSRSRSRGVMGSNHQEAPKFDTEKPPPITFVQPVLVSPIPSYVHPPRFPRDNFEAEPPSQFQNRMTPLCLETMDDIIARPKRPLPSRRPFVSTAIDVPASSTNGFEAPTLSGSNAGGVEPLGVDGFVREETPSPLMPAPLMEDTSLRRPSSVASNIAVNGDDLDEPSPLSQDNTLPEISNNKNLDAESNVTPSPCGVRPRPPLPSFSDHRHGMFLDDVLKVLSHRKASSPSPTSTQGLQLSTVEGSPINDEVSNYPFTPSARQPAVSYLSRPLRQGDCQGSTLARGINPVADSSSACQRKCIVDGYSSDDVVVYVAPGAKANRVASKPRGRSCSWIGITEGRYLYALVTCNRGSN
jgi:hypothetical protein